MASSIPREPDPLAGLYHEQVRMILTMPPTWSERWRMSGIMSAEKRREILIDILMERRRDYLIWYEKAKTLAKLSRDEAYFGAHHRKLEDQDKFSNAHYLAQRNLLNERMRRSGREQAAYYERKLNNGRTLAEIRTQRKEEAAYLAGLASRAADLKYDRGR